MDGFRKRIVKQLANWKRKTNHLKTWMNVDKKQLNKRHIGNPESTNLKNIWIA